MKTIYFLCLLILFISCSDEDDNLNTSSCSNECAIDVSADEFAATVPDNIAGEYSLTYTKINPGGPFSDGDVVDFSISTNNELTVEISGDCVNIKNPILFAQGTTEANFRDDCVFNAMFGVTENQSGELNEINVATLDFQFFGQFKNE